MGARTNARQGLCQIQGPDSGTSFRHSENPLRSPKVNLWRRRVLPSADDEIVESGRERLTADSPTETGGCGEAAPEGKESENGRDRLSCSNVANAISRAIAALDLGQPDLTKQELLGLLRQLWRLDGGQ